MSLSRRDFLKASASGIFLGPAAGMLAQSRSSRDNPKKKNVVFIVVDDLNTTLRCYGHPLVQTPHIDALAQLGVRFENACCNYAVCNPSRSSFLTGLRPDSTGIFDNKTPFNSMLSGRTTLPRLFRENGYYTKRLGKVFHGSGDYEDGLAWDEKGDPAGTSRGKQGTGRNMTDGALSWCRWLAADGDDEDQSDGNIAAQAVNFLKAKHNQPFFLALGFHKPHDPFIAPARYFALYPLEDCAPPKIPQGWEPLDCLSLPCGTKAIFDKFDDQDKREFLRAYYACTTFMDAQIGKVVQALRNNNLMDDTLIMIFGDHGYHLGEHGWWNKVTVFERSHRSALVMVVPRETPAGSTCHEIVEFVDFFPTLVDLCGLSGAPADLEGISFRALLNDPAAPWKEAGYIQVKRESIFGRAVHTQRWRYVEWDQGKRGIELYDHDTDPREYFNLADNPDYTGQLEYLKNLLHSGQNRLREPKSASDDNPMRGKRV